MTEPTNRAERAVVYTPKEGDVVVLEIGGRDLTITDVDHLEHQAREAFGRDVKVVVLAGARFAGVVRDE